MKLWFACVLVSTLADPTPAGDQFLEPIMWRVLGARSATPPTWNKEPDPGGGLMCGPCSAPASPSRPVAPLPPTLPALPAFGIAGHSSFLFSVEHLLAVAPPHFCGSPVPEATVDGGCLVSAPHLAPVLRSTMSLCLMGGGLGFAWRCGSRCGGCAVLARGLG